VLESSTQTQPVTLDTSSLPLAQTAPQLQTPEPNDSVVSLEPLESKTPQEPAEAQPPVESNKSEENPEEKKTDDENSSEPEPGISFRCLLQLMIRLQNHLW
jgi:hypothetical protein